MSLTTQSVRIAGKVYELNINKRPDDFVVRVKQYPGIVATSPDEGKAVDSAIKAIVDKVSENQGKT